MADGAEESPGWDPLLTPKEAAKLLRKSAKTLERWRSDGGGPEYVKLGGSVLYLQSALRRFVGERAHGKAESCAEDPS